MDKVINILKNWVEVNLSTLKTGKSPHVSFIVSTIVGSPVSRSLIDNLSGYDALRICYVIFHMFEGLSIEEAKKKAQNIHMVTHVEMDDISDEKIPCNTCDGNGTINCDECDGEGHEDCNYCDGEGVVTSDADGEEEECGDCNNGTNICFNCDGNSEIDCPDCDTDGKITTGQEYIDFNSTNWTFTNDKLYQTYLDKISGKIQNSDFYDESNENLGDLFLLNSVYDGERLEDFVFPDIQSDESKVSSVYEKIPEYWKSKITIEKYGNRNNDYRIR